MAAGDKRRVAVVTGGAGGIGGAIAEELGRCGAFVVTLDPVVAPDGSARLGASGPTTVERIIEAGGAGRTAAISVTDEEAVRSLFADLVQEFGSLNTVVNCAGIVRRTDFASGSEDDWAEVLSVHLGGYLNILGAALPLMAQAGYGRILGVTSGSGWRLSNTGAYGSAKRAIASLTWQIGRLTPPGVTVNSLSPLAESRMDSKPDADTAATSGLSGSRGTAAMLGPVGAYLTSEGFSWCRGEILFANGSELARIAPPSLLEVCRSRDVASLSQVLEAVLPTAFASAETAQTTNGGSNPRFGPIFEQPVSGPGPMAAARTCLLVSDDPEWGTVLNNVLISKGVECVGIGAVPGAHLVSETVGEGFSTIGEQIRAAASQGDPLDAVVVALRNGAGIRDRSSSAETWQRVLDQHAGIVDDVRTDAGWAQAVAGYAIGATRSVRLILISDATSPGGQSRAQAAAQLSRAGHLATSGRVSAYAISVETNAESVRRPVADLVAHLMSATDLSALAGAELVVDSGWFGLRAHPAPAATVTYGGPSIPDWLDQVLHAIVAPGS